MAYQAVFKRYELKYLITEAQKLELLRAMESRMARDAYGRTTVRNLYFDTRDFRIIRRSLEKPAYKEKLRIRSYDRPGPQSNVFVELKKKYNGVVYKRRMRLPQDRAMAWLEGTEDLGGEGQIAREIRYFLAFYRELRPKVFLSYEREAYYDPAGSDFRVTFDENILCRQQELTLESDAWGTPLLPAGFCLMELKCSGGIPLWMTEVLSREKIRKTSFSKYGTAYETVIFPKLKGECSNAQPNLSRRV